MLSDKFRIALIGRTNVGKSTLFNRMSGFRDALTFDRPGVTRDIKENRIDICGKQATIFDTPGMYDYTGCDNNPQLISAIETKLSEIIKCSDLILFVIDGDIGVTPNDREIAKILRKNGKNVVLAVNKSEKKTAEHSYIDAMSLGFCDIVKISAEHGIGISELYDTLSQYIPEMLPEENIPSTIEGVIKLAIVGRPNVGKSTIVNKIIGEERQLVADFAGVTRESSSVDFEFANRQIRIIDTPGIRRKSRIKDVLEKISVSNSKNSYKRADAVILVIDATTLIAGEIEKQDLTLASDIITSGKTLVIAFNKYDKTPYKKNDNPEFLKRNFSRSFAQLKDVPFLFTSAINSENISQMLQMVISSYDKQAKRIKTSDLNEWLSFLNQSDVMQSGSARFKLKYITQIGSIPPTFLVFVTNKTNMRADHERYIINNLKSSFDLEDVAVKVIFREQKR